MTVASFFGYALTAYGPAISIFFLYVAKNAQLVILTISSGFFLLVSMLVSAIVWYIISPLRNVQAFTIGYGVLIQEVFRYAFFRLLDKAEDGLALVSKTPNSQYNKMNHAFVSGLGFGLMSALISFITQLSESVGPGAVVCNSCPGVSVAFISALTTMLFSLLHITWSMIAYEGLHKKSYNGLALVTVAHLAASYSTLLIPSTIYGGCGLSIFVCIIILGTSTCKATEPLLAKIKSQA